MRQDIERLRTEHGIVPKSQDLGLMPSVTQEFPVCICATHLCFVFLPSEQELFSYLSGSGFKLAGEDIKGKTEKIQ